MTNQDEFITSDQTAFGAVEPLFEQQPTLLDPNTPPPPPRPKWKNPLVIGGVVALILVVLILILALLSRPRSTRLDRLPSPSPSASVELGPWQKRIKELQAELRAADPAQQELPFPPVKMDLPLDPPGKTTTR